MASEVGGQIKATIVASADLSANQFQLVSPAGAIPAAGAPCAGVQINGGGVAGSGPLSGEAVEIALGFCKVVTNGSAILVGSRLSAAGTTGVAKLSVTDADDVIGIALEANGSTAGRIIKAIIFPMGRIA